MLKSELIEQLAIENRMPVAQAEKFLNTLTKIIYKTLADGGEVTIAGFGKFNVSHREARMGVNPRNPSIGIMIRKLKTPKFRAGEAFKKAVAIK